MFDVRDLEVPPERGDWGSAPDSVRAACALLVSLTALAALRAWMVLGEWHEFLRVYGRSHHLDMTSEAGWTESALRAPGQWSAMLDLGLVLIAVLLVLGVLHRSSECRTFGVVVAVAVTLDTLAPLAYPVPWWYVVASSMLALACTTLVLLLTRPRTTMHLRPEPLSHHERLLEPRPGPPPRPPRPNDPSWPPA